MKGLTKIILLLILICVLAITVFPDGGNKKSADDEIEILLDRKIRMKDGIKLSANVYKPAEMKEPLPAIFAFTPYISDEGQERGPFFAKNGYVYVHVDVRGRGNSEGEFFPLEKDGADGAQVVQWIAKQPWCNGKVGMRGGSYRGMVQWQTLKHFPPALKTIIPTAAAAPGVDFPMPHNIFVSYDAQWLGFTLSKTKNTTLFADQEYWLEKFYRLYSRHLPFAKLAEMTGSNTKIFERWLAHPYFDRYWQGMTFPDKSYEKIDIPVLTITGHFDGDQPGAMHYYRKHMRFGKEDIKNKHYVIIGPWDHAGTRHPRKELGGLVFGDDAVLDMEQLHLEWYDWLLKGKAKPKFLKKRVCYYLMNENNWKYCDNLKDVSNQTQTWYLSSKDGEAHDVFNSGLLTKTPPREKQAADVFEYDPLKVISKEEYIRQADASLLDQGDAFADDKLIYHSPPLKEAVEIAGHAKLKVFIELNVPDTDFGMALYEIRKDGKSIPLAQDFMRARYRNSLSKPELVKPGKIYKYIFDKSYFFAGKLEKGSRLRLVFSSLNSPMLEKNYNSGGVVAEETAKDARKAVIKLHHDPDHPGVLELPVLVEKKDKKGKAAGPEMVLVPGGEFIMGKDDKDTNDHYPAHKVYVDSFYMDKYEVTNAEYYRYCMATGKNLPRFWGIDELQCGLDFPDHPVIGVSCYEAKLYAEWRGVRLPTEAEWEYAARGGLVGKSFPLGNDIGPEDGNAANHSAGSAPVGSYKPNGFGLYDMSGNVREWVADYYKEDYYHQSAYKNPKGPGTGRFIVVRGGGFFAGKTCCRVFIRNALKNTWIDFNVGFRCVKDLPGK